MKIEISVLVLSAGRLHRQDSGGAGWGTVETIRALGCFSAPGRAGAGVEP
jgi:hypothetical protein